MPGAPEPPPSLARDPGVLPGLPQLLTPLVGREQELASVIALMRQESVRLLTLTGPGGVGKTRLAVHAAEALNEAFADGVAFVSLAPLQDPGLVAATLARELGVSESGQQPPADALMQALRDCHLLLLLDNFEHLLGAAPLLTDLLAACPRLTLLVTSRAVLRISGEQLFVVPPLSLGPSATADSEAVRLFDERARAASADFALTEENTAAVAEICTRLDGLPLAIELAAARVASLPPVALASRMEQILPLLTSGARDAPLRQQTMHSTIAWSHDLLADDERALFNRLSVFVGGFTLDAADAVSRETGVGSRGLTGNDRFSPAPVLDGIASLLEHSLLIRAAAVAGEPRYAMLETIREFGLERLGASREAVAVRTAHAGWMLALAERAEPELTGPDQGTWVARLDADLDNLRAALSWFQQQGDAGAALRLAGAIGWYLSSPGHLHEGRDLFAALIAMPGAANHPAALAKVWIGAGDVADWLRDTAHAATCFERAMECYRAVGDHRRGAGLLRGLGGLAIDQGDLARATTLLEEARSLARSFGEDWEAAAATNLLGSVAFALGDWETAMARYEEAMAGWQALDDPGHVLSALSSIALTALASRRYDSARVAYRDTFDLATAVGDRWGVVRAMAGFGALAAVRGDGERGARLLAAADAWSGASGALLRPAVQTLFDRITADVHAALGESAFALAWETGRLLSLDDALAETRAEAAETGRPTRRLPTGDAPSPDGLTPRQVEVLRLLAAGLSDREIAGQLSISPRTASKHVAALMARFDVHSRVAAVHAASLLELV
jgi:predicted ATPase/DNA-binding CsgD family transcriptional regulator